MSGPVRPSSEERPGSWRHGLRVSAPLVVRRFPQALDVPALAPAGRTDLPFTTVVRFQAMPTALALRRVREERANVEAELDSLRSRADPRAAVLRQEATAAEGLERELVSRSTRLWETVTGFILQGRSESEVLSRGRSLEEPFRWAGYSFHDPEYRVGPLLGLLSPGEGREESLSHPMTDDGVGALLPLWEDRLDEPGGSLLGLHALEATPLFWDRFAHPSHSSAIFGETGSGKTYASAIGWTRARYFRPNLSVFVLDPLGGLGAVLQALGGTLFRAGVDELAVNPLDPSTTGGDVRAKTARVILLLRSLFPSLSDEEAATVDTLLSGLYSERPPESPPLLEDLHEALSDAAGAPPRLARLLEPLLRGSLTHLNRPTTIDLRSQMLGFDLSGLTSEELPFHLTLFLDLIYGEMRRRPGPKLLVIDEAHYIARSPAVARFLDYLVRHVRHFEGGIEIVSQNPADFLGDEHARSILLNVDSVLLLHLKDGGEGVAPLLGLAAEEVEWLRGAALPGSRGYAEGIFRTGDIHLPVAIVSADEEHELLQEAFRRERSPKRGA